MPILRLVGWIVETILALVVRAIGLIHGFGKGLLLNLVQPRRSGTRQSLPRRCAAVSLVVAVLLTSLALLVGGVAGLLGATWVGNAAVCIGTWAGFGGIAAFVTLRITRAVPSETSRAGASSVEEEDR